VLSSDKEVASIRGLRLGYFVPEFPGQTHSFFWREVQALRKLGAEPVLLSTRLPDSRLVTHAWAPSAMAETVYLFPLTWRQALRCAGHIAAGGPGVWGRLLRGVAAGGPKRWLRSAALTLLGARLVEVAQEHGFRHVHVHSSADAAFIAAFAANMAPLTYSIVLHGALAYFGPGQQFKWHGASFGLVVAEHLRADLLPILKDGGPLIDVAPMGVDLDRFKRDGPYVPWTEAPEPLRVASCGRLNPGKGHQDLIAAVALLRQQGVNVILRICGEDDDGGDGYRKTLQNLLAELDLREAVTLLGAVDESVVRQELANAHLFVLASHEEAIGVAYMEAMAMALPVIGTRVGGVPELITHEHDGLLVQPSNPSELAHALVKVAHTPELAMLLAQRARTTVEDRFGSERSARAVINGTARAVGAVTIRQPIES
jgi:colanic acid/amylovoran biosynthesis glycosyltransferase